MKQSIVELTIKTKIDSGSLELQGLADLRFLPPDRNVINELVVNEPVIFDLEKLNELWYFDTEYGEALTEMLFSQNAIRREWEKVYAYIQGFSNKEPVELSFRLRLDNPFHMLKWELIKNPLTGYPLSLSERILFSRYFDSSDMAPVQIPKKPNIKVLIAAANPSDLSNYKLAPVDVEGEFSRITTALENISCITIHATLNNIFDELRNGCNILYLVCHGFSSRRDNGETYLFLEDGQGKSQKISGKDFAHRIQNLKTPPLLIILASCQSAAFESSSSGISIGPLLSKAGVASVIAMQGNVTMDTVAYLMPPFIQQLMKNGRVDQALAVARSQLTERHDWWIPVLFMRTGDGRIWSVDNIKIDENEVQKIANTRSRIERLKELKQIYDEGLITQQEYDTKKADILSEI